MSQRSSALLLTLALAAALAGCLPDAPTQHENMATQSAALVSTTSSEGFEGGTKGAYAVADVTFASGAWTLNDALVGNSTSDAKTGARAVRVRAAGSLRMGFDKQGGAETVTVNHARYGTDASSTWELWCSTDAAATWARIGAPVTSSAATLQAATFAVHVDGPIRFEIRKTSGAATRIDLDDVTITGYVPSKLKVASWYLRDLSTASRDATEQAKIADVIEKYDAMAVQEINDAQILDSIRVILDGRGGQWATTFSAKNGNTTGTAERYGVIYRTSRLHVTWTRQMAEITTEANVPFDRDPSAVGLGTNDGRFDFAVLHAHVTWGTVVANRIAEVKAMKQYYDLVVPQERDVLVVGDFNRNANDAASIGWLSVNTGLFTTTAADVPTMIASASTYDQLMLNPAFTTEYLGLHGVDRFDETAFANDDAAASLAVSDHRPVWVELQPGLTDDD